jgi:hypothetical protein
MEKTVTQGRDNLDWYSSSFNSHFSLLLDLGERAGDHCSFLVTKYTSIPFSFQILQATGAKSELNPFLFMPW